ncbi:MAG: DUF3857 domain-containing transglutaminase family protein [Saprospiraceae bacterium]
MKTKYRSTLLLIFLFQFFYSLEIKAEQLLEYDVALIPKELLENAHTIIRTEEYKIEIPTYDKIIETKRKVFTILNEKSSADHLFLHYNSFSKINKLEARIYDSSGKLVREIKKKEFTDQSAVSSISIYEDSRMKWLDFNHPSYPFTVEISYKKTTNKYMYYPTWSIQQYGVSVEKASLEIITNDVENLNYTTLNIDLNPTKKTKEESTSLKWQVENKPAILKVGYTLSSYEILPTVLLTPKNFKLEKYKGDMSSWKSFGQFINQLNDGRDVLSDKMKKKVQELTSAVTTDQEKIDILYKYLQENTRYINVSIGIGGWQTFDSDYVEKNKYGDCKALTHFMKGMLAAVDITAYPVYIGAGRDDALVNEEFVYPYFNHVFLNVPSEDYWLECTSSYNPPNYIGDWNANRRAMRVTEQGGELIKTPAFSPEESKEYNKATITLSEKGDAEITNHIQLTGPKQERLRYLSFETTEEEIKEDFLENCGLPTVHIKSYDVKPLLEKPEVQIDYNITAKKYAVKGGKRFFVPLNAINPFSSVPTKKERVRPVVVRQGYVMEDEHTLILPEGYEVESMPDEKVLIESEFGTYQLEIVVSNSELKYSRTLKILPVQLPASSYEAFRDFRKKVAAYDNAKLVLVKKRT